MIAFATLWLGIVTGAMPVQVLAGPEVARVELRLDGAPCAALDGPPWSATCDLGAELAPHELVATAFDDAGREVGEIRQWLNLPRPAAELDVVLAQESPGAVIATLAWAGPGGEEPQAVRVWVDGAPVPHGGSPRVISLPLAASQEARLLRVEAEFSGGVLATRELVFGGPHASETASELTGVPVEGAGRRLRPGASLRAGDRLLPVLALDDGLADLVVVTDPAALDGLVELAAAGGRGRVSRLGLGMAPTGIRTDVTDPTGLAEDLRVRLVWPVPQAQGQGVVRFDAFPTSPERRSADGSLLAQLARIAELPPPDSPPRLADSVALAAITAAQNGRRRAVLLVLGETSSDASLYEAAAVRRYLERLRVPLHVWVTGSPRAAAARWGDATEVSSVPRLTTAARRLFAGLARQRVAWVEGQHLPQTLAPASPPDWRLAGAGDHEATAATADPAAPTPTREGRDEGGERAEAPRTAGDAAEGHADEIPAQVAGDAAAAPPEHAGDAGAGAVITLSHNPPKALTTRPLGPFTLQTDVTDGGLLARLARIAAALPEVYGERLGLAPVPAGGVLLFAREDAFRQWLALQDGASDAGIEGFAVSGRAGLYAGAHDADELAGLLVHELAHLLTRAAVGRPLPPWLEEGLAEELAMSRIDRRGRLIPGSLRSERTVQPVRTGPGGRVSQVERTLRGPAAGLVRLVGTRGARVPLAELLVADRTAFGAPARRQDRYATAGFFVRFLLAPGNERRERFHTFLAAVASGGDADGPALVALLGEPLPELERAFAAWLQRTALAGGE